MKKYILVVIVIILVILGFLFIQSVPNPIGVYVAKNNIKTIDSITIKDNGVYFRAIYRKKDNTIMFRNQGKWKYKNKRIVFTDYFPNDDIELNDGYDYKSVIMIYSVPLEKSFGRVVFEYDEETAIYKFHKQ